MIGFGTALVVLGAGKPALAAGGEQDAPIATSAAKPDSAHSAATNRPGLAGRSSAASALDRRIRLLAAELHLDQGQQAAVRRLLLQQREQTLKVWSDETVPSAIRVKATQSVADRTADQIRALLNEEQRKKYIKPHDRDARQDVASGDLESWMQGRAPNGALPPQ